MCGTLQVLIAKRLVVLPSVWRSLAGLRPAFGAFGPGTAADKTLYRLHALIPQMITFPTHLGIYIISQLPEFAYRRMSYRHDYNVQILKLNFVQDCQFCAE